MNKKCNGIIIFLLLIISYFAYNKVKTNNIEKNNFLNQQSMTQQEEKRQVLKDAIRNQPFYLAGIDAGMPDTGIIDTTDQTKPKTYYVGSEPVITNDGIKIISTFGNFGSKVFNGYGYNSYSPSPEAKGKYLEANLAIENTLKKPITLNMSNIKLSTKDGYEYFPIKQDRDCGADFFQYSKNDEVIEDMNPSSVCKIKFLFDVASTTNSFLIKFN